MAVPFLSSIKLNKNQVEDFCIYNLANDPSPTSGADFGYFWLNTGGSKSLRWWDGTTVRTILDSASTISVADNLSGGVAGSLPYQTAVNDTTFLGIGTADQVLKVNSGATAPEWVSQSTLAVGSATNKPGGALGDILVQSGSGTTTFLNVGSAGQVLTSNGASPAYVDQSTLSVGTAATATNVSGGAAGQLLYQSGLAATAKLGVGTDGYILTYDGINTKPQWSASIPAGSVSGLAASATTDTTNAANITSGLLPLARLALATGQFYVGDASNNPAATAKSSISLTGFGALTADLDIAGFNIINSGNVTSGSSGSTLATKGYVDSVAQGLDIKSSCLVASTADINLSAPGSGLIDGIDPATFTSGTTRILVKDQSLSQQNGIYIWNGTGSEMTRSLDANTWDELVGAFTFIETGTANADSGWVCTANAGGTLGTTPVPFVKFSQAGSYTAGNGMVLSGGVFHFAQSSAYTAGQIPYASSTTAIGFKSVTGTGDVVLATSPTLVTPALGAATATSINKLTITAPATGSTLTIADGKTLTVSNTLTFTGTDSSSVAFGAGGTVAYTGGTLAQFAATTSSQLAGVISDETGTGSLVFATSPTLAGTPLSTTAAADTNTTQIATTAYVVGQASSTTPAALGTAAVGTSLKYARADHVHALPTIDLASGVSGTLPVANGGTGAATFTAGRVLFGAGTDPINTSANLFWNNGNSRLGIGTPTPAGPLSVVGPDSNFVATIGGATKGVRFGTSSNGTKIEGVDNTFAASYQQLTIGGSALNFEISNSVKATLDASGNLGLGVTPSAKFDIATSGAGNPRVRVDQTSDNPHLEFQRYTGVTTKYYGFRITQGYGEAYFQNTGQADIGSQTFTTRMTLDASGNLGIGVAPTSRLTVLGSDATSVARFNAASGRLRFAPYSSYQSTNGVILDSTNTAENAYQPFAIAGSSVFLISDSGNCVLTSDGRFRVSTQGSASTPAFSRTGDIDTGLYFPTDNTLALAVGGSDAVYIDAKRNVGLGMVPSAWSNGYTAIDLKGGASFLTNATIASPIIGANWYINSSDQFIYKANGFASYYQQYNGVHSWHIAPTGTAGNVISGANAFVQAMAIKSTGQLNLTGLAADPTGAAGDLYYSTGNVLKMHNGTAWQQIARKYSVALSGDAGTDFIVTHNLGSRDVTVQVRKTATPFDIVYTDIKMTNSNTVTVTFATTVTPADYTVTVIG